MAKAQPFYCPHCGTFGYPKMTIKGSFLTEVILWLFLLLPGVFYTLWRITTKCKGCPCCEAPNMIPADSPKAVEALALRSGATSAT